MAPPPSITRILKERLRGAAAWVDELLQPLNTFMEQVRAAMSGNLNVSQNLAMCWVQVTVEGGADVRTSVPLTGPISIPQFNGKTPYGLSVENCVLQSGTLDWYPSVLWSVDNSSGVPRLVIDNVYGLNTGAKAVLTLLLKAY